VKLLHKSTALAVLAGGIILASGGAAAANSTATGSATSSPGVLSGNVIEIPIEIPLNVCGDTVDVIALLNPTYGDDCVSH